MSKQKQKQKQDKHSPSIGENLFYALTQQEMAELINALLTILPADLQTQAIAQLPHNTQQTIEQILAAATIGEQSSQTTLLPVSLEKQAQTWAALWQTWDASVDVAAQEEGKYSVQEVRWESPYFDTTTFIDDLESIAIEMLPLIAPAVDHQFMPNRGFLAALSTVESELLSGLPDWMEITEGLYLQPVLTTCVLQWDWLNAQREGLDAFSFVERIRQADSEFWQIEFDRDAVLEFFRQLPEAEQRCILTGLTTHRESSDWKSLLDNTYSHWHHLYLALAESYAPDQYLENLRSTIAQAWQNGLPVIAALLDQQQYTESLEVIAATLQSLLNFRHSDTGWTPETSLLVATVGFYGESEQADAIALLHYYQQVAQYLNQTERANALVVQQLAIAHWFDWSVMLTAFAETSLSAKTRQALLTSWKLYLDRRCRPRTWSYDTTRSESWWMTWLMDSLVDPKKGRKWFQQQMKQWLAGLPGGGKQLGEDYDFLRLLTKDLTEIESQGESSYPLFYEVVIRPSELSSASDSSRQTYLQQNVPADLLEQVMTYWKTHLQSLVPQPESALKSNYTEQARWMLALKELTLQDYEALLNQWRSMHQRRSNLWKALQQVGLS